MRIEIDGFDGFDEIDAFGPFEVLSSAGLDVEFVALEPGEELTDHATSGVVGTPRVARSG